MPTERSIRYKDLDYKIWQELVYRLQTEAFVVDWDDDYADNDVYDGTQWTLNLQFDDGSTKEIIGSNDFPEYWEEFVALINPFLESEGLEKIEIY